MTQFKAIVVTTQPNLQPNLTQLQPLLGLHGNWIQPPPPHTQTVNQIPGNLDRIKIVTTQPNLQPNLT